MDFTQGQLDALAHALRLACGVYRDEGDKQRLREARAIAKLIEQRNAKPTQRLPAGWKWSWDSKSSKWRKTRMKAS